MIILILFFLVGMFIILSLPLAGLVAWKRSHNFKKACKEGDTELAQWYYDSLKIGKLRPSKRKRKYDALLKEAYVKEGNR